MSPHLSEKESKAMKITEFGGWTLGISLFMLFCALAVLTNNSSTVSALVTIWFCLGLIIGSFMGSFGQK